MEQEKSNFINHFTIFKQSGGGFGESSSLQMCGISLDGTAQLFQQVQAGLRQSGTDSTSAIGKSY